MNVNARGSSFCKKCFYNRAYFADVCEDCSVNKEGEEPPSGFKSLEYFETKKPVITQTTKTENVWKVTLADGAEVHATPNHKVLLREGNFKELQELSPGDCSVNKKGEETPSGFKSPEYFETKKPVITQTTKTENVWKQCVCGGYRAYTAIVSNPTKLVPIGGCLACDKINRLQEMLDEGVKIR